MKLRKEKEQIPADFRKQMYENYKANMTLYGKPILPYKQWLKDVFNTKLPCCGKIDGMKTLMIDIMLNDRFYAAFRYKYCPAFKFDIEDMTNKVYERYPTLRKRAMNGEKVVFAF